MQGVRGREHLPAPAHQESMQGVREGGGHVDAGQPRGLAGAAHTYDRSKTARGRARDRGPGRHLQSVMTLGDAKRSVVGIEVEIGETRLWYKALV